MRNIFRWTIGKSSSLGFEILEKSIIYAKKNLNDLDFDFFICSNSNEDKIEKICNKHKINHIVQNEKDYFFKKYGGSFWKLCPPRIDINSHEIICDNDLIIKKKPKELILFLESNLPLICEEKLFCFGKYSKFINKPYNSGLYGLPPGFDFEKNIIKKWRETGSFQKLRSYKDEQGLIILCLLNFEPIIIPNDKICYLFDSGSPVSAEYQVTTEDNFESKTIQNILFEKPKCKDKEIYHFIEANRIQFHHYWHKYKTRFL